MTYPQSWPDLEQWLHQHYACTAILLYGSSMSGPLQPGSDIDLLCLSPEPRLRMVQVSFAQTELDIALGSVGCFERALHKDARGNSNFVLQALVTGRIRSDSDGDLARLMDRARHRAEAGPNPPGARERAILRARCLKIAGAAGRLQLAQTTSPAAARFAETQSAIFLGMLVEDYCRVHQLWASSLRQLLRAQDPAYRALRDLLTSYMEAPPEISRLQMIASFSTDLAHAAQVHEPSPE